MNVGRTILFAVLLLAFGAAGYAGDKDSKGPKITDKIFRQTSALLLDDPLSRSARDWSRLILLYALETPNAASAFSSEELRWAGVEKDDPRSLLLLAAYAAGNIQSQLNSGVKRNDRYSGLLTLFRVYRVLRDQKKPLQIAAVDDLLALHEKNKLIAHLQELDEKKPAKMTSHDEAVIRRLMRTR
jgi:hypothetical protein